MKTHSVIVALLAALLAGAAWAADTSKVPASMKFALVRAEIADDRWVPAIEELKRIDEPGDPDWNNLMGYSFRKAKKPDYAAAERYYDAALALDPGHRGALEYSGELYLVLGNLPRAEQRLATLGQVCQEPCLEYALLKNAIDAYKANGNRYVEPPK